MAQRRSPAAMARADRPRRTRWRSLSGAQDCGDRHQAERPSQAASRSHMRTRMNESVAENSDGVLRNESPGEAERNELKCALCHYGRIHRCRQGRADPCSTVAWRRRVILRRQRYRRFPEKFSRAVDSLQARLMSLPADFDGRRRRRQRQRPPQDASLGTRATPGHRGTGAAPPHGLRSGRNRALPRAVHRSDDSLVSWAWSNFESRSRAPSRRDEGGSTAFASGLPPRAPIPDEALR